ncbi:hypothetical protein R6Q59_009985 [Mikania micrantha]
MEAGQHVLIEKPIASNAEEVRMIRDTATRTGKVALEAFHWRFHPAAHRCREIVRGGRYGEVLGAKAKMELFKGLLADGDIRFDYKSGSRACKDLTYVFSAAAFVASEELSRYDVRVLEAPPRLCKRDELVDEAMRAKFVIDEPGKMPVTCEVFADAAVTPLWGLVPKIWCLQTWVVIQLERAEIQFDNLGRM